MKFSPNTLAERFRLINEEPEQKLYIRNKFFSKFTAAIAFVLVLIFVAGTEYGTIIRTVLVAILISDLVYRWMRG